MWRLWNKLFGWDYVFYFASLYNYGVGRIHVDKTGTHYIRDSTDEYIPLAQLVRITWLTCKPEKYFPKGE